jgi:hypothetical protein
VPTGKEKMAGILFFGAIHGRLQGTSAAESATGRKTTRRRFRLYIRSLMMRQQPMKEALTRARRRKQVTYLFQEKRPLDKHVVLKTAVLLRKTDPARLETRERNNL